jgi:amino acid transporter
LLSKQEEETIMKKTLVIALAAGALLGLDTLALAQTPAVGDAPAAATVGQDAAIARQREINRERGMTTGSAMSIGTAGQINRGMRRDRMLPERFAPDAEEAAPAGH